MAAGYPFVGREDVLGELGDALERAAVGRGGLVTLTGASGAGKTRTAEEAAARSAGFRPLWIWCPPGTAGRAFRPWSRLLRELAADDVRCGRLVAASPPLRTLVSGAAPDTVPGAAAGPRSPGGDADPESARLRLTGDVAELLTTAALRRPLLLVLDDLHAADASSLRLLLELADTARTAPVLLLATAREDDSAWHDRAWARAQLLRRGRTLPLGPLRAPDVAALVETATGAPPTAEVLRALLRRTGGEAFFVTEALRAGGVVPAGGAAEPFRGGGLDGGGTPATEAAGSAEAAETAGVPSAAVRAAVAARLGELGPRAARVLDVAAVLGTRFRIDVLAEAAGVPLAEVRGLLGEADRAGLLGEVAPDRAAFRHDLLREAVYGILTPAGRAGLHHAVAEVLAGHARRGRDTGPAEVAHHLLLAGPERIRKAAAYAREAAVRAEALSAFEDAARWYERAAEAYEHAGPAPGDTDTDTDSDTDLVEVLLGLGSARLGAGEREGSRAVLLRAARLARAARRPDLLARAALGLGTGAVGFEVDLADREQLDLLTEARAALPAAHPALRALVTARLSLATALVESEERRVGLAEEAVRTAREAGDPVALGPALAALCDARSGPDHCRERLARSGETVGIGRALSDPVLELLGRRFRLVALLETGDLGAADAEALAYETAVRPLRRPLYAWYVPLWRGSRALREGRYDDCAAAAEETEALGRAAGSANAALLAGTQRWCLYTETGDLGAMTRLLAAMPPLDRLPGLWPRVTLALLAAQYGRLDEAALRLSAVAPRLATGPRDSEWLPMAAQAAETVGVLGAHPAAPLLYDLLAPYAGLFVVEGIGAAVRGPVERHLALLAAAMADPERALAHRERALRAAREAGAPALAARIGTESGDPGAAGSAGSDGSGGAVGPGDRRASARPGGSRAAEGLRPGSAVAVFRREGPLWHLAYAGREVRLADSKGLRDIAVLLARPGIPVPAVELAAAPAAAAPATVARAEGLHPVGDTGEVVDATARAAYRRRLRELDTEAEDADTAGDARRSERVAAERDALLGQLSAAYGIGGRVRRAGSPAERARTAVTARIRTAVRRVADAHPDLGRHLTTALSTGTLCVYRPETPPDWRL
ncbi:AAA family ATPase [Streptomyces sp. NPDC047000]|uniref:ATP-binding protein n=1 Tax=Streptomyces sp. NPDC047000 TaxID=3155474 RepID=UPI0033D0E4B3